MELADETPTTVLVGPNNSGKTSVMDAVRFFSDRGEDRKKVTIHDFSKRRRRAFGQAERALRSSESEEDSVAVLWRYLPRIRITLTFEYADTPEDLNIAQGLLMGLSPDDNLVTLRIEFAVKDAIKLATAYAERRRPEETSLYDVIEADLMSYFGFSYYKVSTDGSDAMRLDDGAIASRIIRVDMISAQRHVDDAEGAQAAKISKLLHSHYTTYVKKEDKDDFDAIEDAIRDSSVALTASYESVFAQLIERLRGFGYPQGNAKPDLRIRAEMSSETIYRDNTKIYYAAPVAHDDDEDTELLPERYNGLGYKNLIYIVLQLESFRAAVLADPSKRPGVHLIGIEEPEAHLHPQMQAVFINEISNTLEANDGAASQIILSTHSPHIVSDSSFSPIRYFQKTGACVRIKDLSTLGRLIGPTFDNDPDAIEAALTFLRRYVKLTHCDLLFADKAILVEGQVEKLLLPSMIAQVASDPQYVGFDRQFVAVLEIGGAYAHKIDPLLQFLGIPTLVIADIDSANADRTKASVADGVISTNAVIGHFISDKPQIADLMVATPEDKIVGKVRIAYQTSEDGYCGRSFEEAFIYANSAWIETNADAFTGVKGKIDAAIAAGLIASAYETGQTLGKVDFALDLLAAEGWRTPGYIDEGLKWLALEARIS
jgi:hypothetical protein